jgi:chromosome segregation ATPase
LLGQLATLTESFSQLSDHHTNLAEEQIRTSDALSRLQADHNSLNEAKTNLSTQLQSKDLECAELTARLAESASRLSALVQEHDHLQAHIKQLNVDLQASCFKLSSSEDARIAAEVILYYLVVTNIIDKTFQNWAQRINFKVSRIFFLY